MTRRIPADAKLRDLTEQSVGLALTDPISRRLDGLIDLAEATGERTTRKEMIAALILSARADGDGLASAVRQYRAAEVRDALLEDASASIVDFRSPAPGPRRRRRSE